MLVRRDEPQVERLPRDEVFEQRCSRSTGPGSPARPWSIPFPGEVVGQPPHAQVSAAMVLARASNPRRTRKPTRTPRG